MSRLNEQSIANAVLLGCIIALMVAAHGCIIGCTSIRHALGHDREELTADSFPPEIAAECVRAKAAAVRWYVRRYGVEPIVLPTRVTWAAEPMQCGSVLAGAWTGGAASASTSGQDSPIGRGLWSMSSDIAFALRTAGAEARRRYDESGAVDCGNGVVRRVPDILRVPVWIRRQ